MVKISLILFVICASVFCLCHAQNANIRRLNIKLNRLSRQTNVLQQDVDDIWSIILTSGIHVQELGNKTRTDNFGIDNTECMTKLNGTISTFQELKAAVE